ncbi:hypothetical protein [Dactylosporangium sp. CA-152071]|uniref:hypothetical protein n=1 Tax=Dactylosporangium sp. CA-152071 TaxID=3239933 RepID=UPI003D9005CD
MERRTDLATAPADATPLNLIEGRIWLPSRPVSSFDHHIRWTPARRAQPECATNFA